MHIHTQPCLPCRCKVAGEGCCACTNDSNFMALLQEPSTRDGHSECQSACSECAWWMGFIGDNFCCKAHFNTGLGPASTGPAHDTCSVTATCHASICPIPKITSLAMGNSPTVSCPAKGNNPLLLPCQGQQPHRSQLPVKGNSPITASCPAYKPNVRTPIARSQRAFQSRRLPWQA